MGGGGLLWDNVRRGVMPCSGIEVVDMDLNGGLPLFVSPPVGVYRPTLSVNCESLDAPSHELLLSLPTCWSRGRGAGRLVKVARRQHVLKQPLQLHSVEEQQSPACSLGLR